MTEALCLPVLLLVTFFQIRHRGTRWYSGHTYGLFLNVPLAMISLDKFKALERPTFPDGKM